MHAQLTYSVGRCNVVSESDGFSLLNAVVLAKLLVCFSSACCTDAVLVSLINRVVDCDCSVRINVDRHTDTPTKYSLRMRAEG